MRWILLLLPWIELFTLIRLGASIGAFATLLYVFVTFMLGVALMRLQGMEMLARLREAQLGWSVPPRAMIDEMALGLGGLLLAIPGLVTDTLGVVMLVGPLLRRLTGGNGQRPPPTDFGRPPGRDDPLEGEFRRLDDD
jgi:UPF0716 protein FxsA